MNSSVFITLSFCSNLRSLQNDRSTNHQRTHVCSVYNYTLDLYVQNFFSINYVFHVLRSSFIMAIEWFWDMPILLMSVTKLSKPVSHRLSNFIIGVSTGMTLHSSNFTNIGFAIISFNFLILKVSLWWTQDSGGHIDDSRENWWFFYFMVRFRAFFNFNVKYNRSEV